MQIKCTQCGFSRQVNDDQIPASSSFATCPKCGTRFRFRVDQAEEGGPALGESLREEYHRTEGGAEAPKNDDIWESMDKMRQEWDEIDRSEDGPEGLSRPGRGNSQDEERLREEAQRAYQQAASPDGRIPFHTTVGSVPWEYKGGFLNPIVFLRTALLMVTRMPQFFSGVNPFSSIIPAWVFLVVVRGVQMGMAIMSIKLVHTLPDGTQQILNLYDLFNIPTLMLMSVCVITIMHFLGSFIVNYTIQLHTGPKANFRLTFKVMAYANMPVLLAVLPGLGSLSGLFFSLVLLFFGIRYAYRFSWRKTVISVMPYLILSVLFLMMLLQSAVGGVPAA